MNYYQQAQQLLTLDNRFDEYLNHHSSEAEKILFIWNKLSNQNNAQLNHALVMAFNAHIGQLRKGLTKTGEVMPYIYHPLRIANKCFEQSMPHEYVCVALLHDTLEDTFLGQPTLEDGRKLIEYILGKRVAQGVFSLSSPNTGNREERNHQMYTALSQSNRYIQTIKILDRTDNLNEMLKTEKQFSDAFLVIYLRESENLSHVLNKSDKVLHQKLDNLIEVSKKSMEQKIIDNENCKLNQATKPVFKNITDISCSIKETKDSEGEKCISLLVKKHALKQLLADKEKNFLEKKLFLGNSKYYFIPFLSHDEYSQLQRDKKAITRYCKDLKNKNFDLQIYLNKNEKHSISFLNHWLNTWRKFQRLPSKTFVLDKIGNNENNLPNKKGIKI